jgi:hypothetical protein
MPSIDVDAVDEGFSSVKIALEGFEVCGSEAMANCFGSSIPIAPVEYFQTTTIVIENDRGMNAVRFDVDAEFFKRRWRVRGRRSRGRLAPLRW